MAWPEYGEEVTNSWYLKWQSEVIMAFRSEDAGGLKWYFWFLVRAVLYVYVLFHVFRYTKRNIPVLLGNRPIWKNPNLRKLRRVVFISSFY